MEEIEVKFLNINPDLIQKKLKEIGAKKVFERLYKRKAFDYEDLRLDKDGAWIRIRDEGDKITLGFKKRIGINVDGKGNDKSMEEIEVEVNDFEKTADILLKAGFIEKHYAENKRIRYQLDDIEFDIDFWPQLNPYLEIEAPSWERIDEAILLLGLNPKDKKVFSTYQIYELKGIDLNDYKKITFDEIIKKK
jgi:adenylate cyclase class 2